MSHNTERKFGDLPEVPELAGVKDYEGAVALLFEGEAENIFLLNAKGGELHIAYSALYKGQRCFVKIIREDNPYSKNMFYSYEWALKERLDEFGWLNQINAELVVPDKGATFVLNNFQHYIASYEHIPGQTLVEVFREFVIASQYFAAESKKQKLMYSFRRYGQVLAVLNHDPKLPEGNPEQWLKQPVRLMLSDRNGMNEVYDSASDRVYLIDLSEEQDGENNGDVESSLSFWLDSLVDLIIAAHKKYGSDKRNFSELLYLLYNAFCTGYSESLPEYNEKTLMRMFDSLISQNLKQIGKEEPWLSDALKMIEAQA